LVIRNTIKANRQSLIFEELRGIALKTFGLADALRAALSTLADRIKVVKWLPDMSISDFDKCEDREVGKHICTLCSLPFR
jgi:hypothetical protein